MHKLIDRTLPEFADILASDAPAPGGGSTAALEAALGAALTAMVCALTQGRQKYADFAPHAAQAEQELHALRAELLELIDRDAESFQAVSAVFAMPKSTDAEKAARRSAMKAALLGCTQSPLRVMELSCRALEVTASLVGRSNSSAASDLGCAALSLKAALQGAWLNVCINLGGLKDPAQADQLRSKGEALLEQALPLADRIYQEILASL